MTAQPCSYIYPIYSVVKHRPRQHMQHLLRSVAATRSEARLELTAFATSSRISARRLFKRRRLNLELVCFDSPCGERDGGADRDRTDDILLAKQALSQLSYSPLMSISDQYIRPVCPMRISGTAKSREGDMVGLGRLELPTSPLSGVRSSQLSYRPGIAGFGLSRCGLLALRARERYVASL